MVKRSQFADGQGEALPSGSAMISFALNQVTDLMSPSLSSRVEYAVNT